MNLDARYETGAAIVPTNPSLPEVSAPDVNSYVRSFVARLRSLRKQARGLKDLMGTGAAGLEFRVPLSARNYGGNIYSQETWEGIVSGQASLNAVISEQDLKRGGSHNSLVFAGRAALLSRLLKPGIHELFNLPFSEVAALFKSDQRRVPSDRKVFKGILDGNAYMKVKDHKEGDLEWQSTSYWLWVTTTITGWDYNLEIVASHPPTPDYPTGQGTLREFLIGR